MYIRILKRKIMCGQFGQSNLDKILNFKGEGFLSLNKKQNLTHSGTEYSAVVKPNQKAYIFSSDFYKEAIFGFTKGENSEGKSRYWFNARVEYFENKTNDKNYNGPYLIFENKHLKSILHQRAIIPISHFIESTDGKPKSKHVIHKLDKSPLFLGGIWFEQENELCFCILTTTANNGTNAIQHRRSPIIIEEADVADFLNTNLSTTQLETYFKPNNNLNYKCFEIDPSQLNNNNLFSVQELDDFNPINEPTVINA